MKMYGLAILITVAYSLINFFKTIKKERGSFLSYGMKSSHKIQKPQETISKIIQDSM